MQPGLYKGPLELGWLGIELYDMDTWKDFLAAGQIGIYVDKIEDSTQLHMDWDQDGDAASLTSLYYGLTTGFANLGFEWLNKPDGAISSYASGDTYDYAELGITYGASEEQELRNLFGQTEGSTSASLIEDGIASMATSVATFQEDTGKTRFKINAIKTKPFTGNELTLLTESEEDQGVSLSLETVTGSAGVTSTSDYTTGGMY